MQTHSDTPFLQKLRQKLRDFREELKKDSVAANPRKPVDCCNPPEPHDTDQKLKS